MRATLTPAMVVLACGAAACAQPANDSCSTPDAIAGFTTVAFDSSLATTDGVGNALCNFFSQQGIDHDLWWVWTPSAPGPTRITTCSLTTVDTKIAVYDGASCPEGNGIVACSDDSCGTQTTAGWTALTGHTYLIRVGTYPGAAGGAGSFTISSGVLVGPVVNAGNGHSYYLLSPSTWTDGEAAAVTMGGHLATVRSADENEFIRTQVLGFDGQDRRGWIGFNDVASAGTYVWSSGEPVVYTNWNAGEPNNIGVEHYTEFFGSNGEWNNNTNAPPFNEYPIVEVAQGVCVCYPNCDGSTSAPILNVLDFGCFLNKFAAGDTYANCDASTTTPVLNVLDFGCFLNKFAAGCSAC